MDLDGSDGVSALESSLQNYALHDAAETGDENLVEGILSNAVKDVDFDPEALDRGNDELDIDELDDSECSPLHIALLKGHLQVAELLLSKGASLKIGCEGSPPLIIAVCSAAHSHRRDRATAAVTLLLDHGASATQRDDNGGTALHWAALLGLPEVITILLMAADAQAAKEAAAMQAAIQAANPESEIPPIGLPPSLYSFQDKQGNTALHLAASAPHTESFSLLLGTLEGRQAASTINKLQQTPLHVAAAHGRAWAVQQLLLLNPKAAGRADKFGRTPLEWANYCGHKVVADVFQRHAGGLDLGSLDLQAQPEVVLLPTLIVAPPACQEHRTAPEPLVRGIDLPPENVRRLHVLTDPAFNQVERGQMYSCFLQIRVTSKVQGYNYLQHLVPKCCRDLEDGILRTSEFARLHWDEQNRLAPLADVMRVHEWNYVRKFQRICSTLADDPTAIGHMDADTALSRRTWHAALASAGACCHAVDAVMNGLARNVFCAVRPPGHHAGPLGTVTSANDPHGSQGFCFLNNIAIAGAYAVNVYRHRGIRRIALLDFDVHHGNGTQACIARVVPHVVQSALHTPLADGTMSFPAFHPWMDDADKENIFFGSVQCYGKRPHGSWMYPGSGATCDTKAANGSSEAGQNASAAAFLQPPLPASDGFGDVPPDDPDLEFATIEGDHPQSSGPRVINVGIAGPGSEIPLWRRAWRDKILPAVAEFKPDMIIVSAGFDAHKKDDINNNFVGVTERDYYWLTQQLVALANTVCEGRLVSALEGGYRIQGGVVSAFARSVAAHVRALSEFNGQTWTAEEGKRQRAAELQRRREVLATKRANAIKAAERAAARELAAAQEAANVAAAAETAGVGSIAAVPTLQILTEGPQEVAEVVVTENGSDRRKRRRAPVDYAALNIKLEEEERVSKAPSSIAPAAPYQLLHKQ